MVVASAREGGIRLEAPAGSRFGLEAESRRGAVDLDAPGLEVTGTDAGPPRRATAVMGGGGPTVKLVADEDVVVTAGSARPPAEQP
jgi:hypothetical protein